MSLALALPAHAGLVSVVFLVGRCGRVPQSYFTEEDPKERGLRLNSEWEAAWGPSQSELLPELTSPARSVPSPNIAQPPRVLCILYPCLRKHPSPSTAVALGRCCWLPSQGIAGLDWPSPCSRLCQGSTQLPASRCPEESFRRWSLQTGCPSQGWLSGPSGQCFFHSRVSISPLLPEPPPHRSPQVRAKSLTWAVDTTLELALPLPLKDRDGLGCMVELSVPGSCRRIFPLEVSLDLRANRHLLLHLTLLGESGRSVSSVGSLGSTWEVPPPDGNERGSGITVSLHFQLSHNREKLLFY